MGGHARLARLSALALLAVATAGCPYESRTPLGPEREARLERALLGAWTCHGGDGAPWTLTLYAFDDRQYLAHAAATGEEPMHLRAFSTTLSSELRFLNLQELKPGRVPRQQPFLLARYALDGDALSLRFVKAETLKAALGPGRSVRSVLAARPDDAALYEAFAECRRAAAP